MSFENCWLGESREGLGDVFAVVALTRHDDISVVILLD
jgi:hypothetical protein